MPLPVVGTGSRKVFDHIEASVDYDTEITLRCSFMEVFSTLNAQCLLFMMAWTCLDQMLRICLTQLCQTSKGQGRKHDKHRISISRTAGCYMFGGATDLPFLGLHKLASGCHVYMAPRPPQDISTRKHPTLVSNCSCGRPRWLSIEFAYLEVCALISTSS